MNQEIFEKLLDELDDNSVATLKSKNAKYSRDGDALHNFHAGAEIMGCTTAQACWNYMGKHLTALRDKVMYNDFSDREDLLEKCQDAINYIRFLWCIGNEERDKDLIDVVNCYGDKVGELINEPKGYVDGDLYVIEHELKQILVTNILNTQESIYGHSYISGEDHTKFELSQQLNPSSSEFKKTIFNKGIYKYEILEEKENETL